MTDTPPPSESSPREREGRIVGGEVLAWLVIALVTLSMAAYALYRPGANTDLIFYAATVHQWDGLDDAAIHEAALRDAREHLAPDVYEAMISENEYMRTVTADPEALVQQIPFYSVKVLFPALMIALRAVGIPLGDSQLYIAVVSYVLLSLLVFAWIRRHVPRWPAVALSTFIILAPPWGELARIQSPDALSVLLGIAALFALLELRRPTLAFGFFMLSVLARPNVAVMVVAVAVGLALLVRSHPLHMRWRTAFIWSGIAVATAGVLMILMGYYGLGTLFYHALVEYLPYPADELPHLSPSEIARLFAFKLANLWQMPIPIFALIGALALRARIFREHPLWTDAPSMMVLAMFATLTFGFVTYPNEVERIQAMPFLALTLILAISIPSLRYRSALDPG